MATHLLEVERDELLYGRICEIHELMLDESRAPSTICERLFGLLEPRRRVDRATIACDTFHEDSTCGERQGNEVTGHVTGRRRHELENLATAGVNSGVHPSRLDAFAFRIGWTLEESDQFVVLTNHDE